MDIKLGRMSIWEGCRFGEDVRLGWMRFWEHVGSVPLRVPNSRPLNFGRIAPHNSSVTKSKDNS